MEWKKQIAIVGTAPDSLRDCPWQNEQWDIWALSERPELVPRYTAWFELHNLERKRQKSQGYWEQLKHMQTPLFTAHAHPELPHARVFPKDEVMQRFGGYFTNTISWLLAYAIMQDPDEIALFGVNMAQDTEYAAQRPSCEYFIGWAMGLYESKGRPRIIIPPESDLLKCRRLYGFDDAGDRMALKMMERNRDLANRLAEQERNFEQCDRSANMLLGAMNELEVILSNGCSDALRDQLLARSDDLKAQLQQALETKQDAFGNVKTIQGAQQNQRWVSQGF